MLNKVQRVALILIAVMGVLVTVFLVRMESRLGSMKLMRNELQSLRTSVSLFRTIEGRPPAGMRELVESSFSYEDDDQRRPFVDPSLVGETGLVLDPFGNPYVINSESGWVRSTTPGYELW